MIALPGRYWVLLVFLVLVALMGGGARADILSLVILRPLAVLVCGFAAWSLTPQDVARHRFTFAMIAVVIVLLILQLVPLPSALWRGLPGRAPIVRIDAVSGLGDIWRPLTLTPADTRNALFSLSVPLAVLLLAAKLERGLLERLLPAIIALGLLSGVLGVLQLVGSPTGPLYLYAQTNYGMAVGLFANRNHQAVFLATLFPMLAVFVTTHSGRSHALRDGFAALAAGIFLVPLLLVTGSRAGILVALVGLAAVPWLLRLAPAGRKARTPHPLWQWLRSPRGLMIGGLVLILLMGGLTVALSRAEAVNRLLHAGADEELRFKVWPIILNLIPQYLPLGSGSGSFVQVFQMAEPDQILRPTYLNHAHNDLLEVLLTNGIPGALLLLAAGTAWVLAARRAFVAPLTGEGVLFARLGVVVIGQLALGSLSDYPLRTPFLAGLLVLATLWSGRGGVKSFR